MILDPVDSSAIFAAGLTSSAQLGGMQQRSLARGADLYSNGDYEQAIKEFTRAVGYAPRSDYAVQAYQFMAQAYSQLDDGEGAINAYLQAIRIAPDYADPRAALANVYYFRQDYDNAVIQYEAAVRIDPSETNHFSLGQGYLAQGRYAEAEAQFRRVKSLNPNHPAGDFGLGQVYAKQGQYDAAIGSFEDALALRRDYFEASSEMGYALADSGRLDEARQIQSDLASDSPALAYQLGQYLASKTPPKFQSVYSVNFDTVIMGPGTLASDISGYLAAPDSNRVFSMSFLFSKPMDAASVQNIFNWSISRSANLGPGSGYNFGLAVPDTELSLLPHPRSVFYDEARQMATVFFSVSQNSAGNGTLDPSHIQFTFSGQDADGLKMDGKADQYAGYSGIA